MQSVLDKRNVSDEENPLSLGDNDVITNSFLIIDKIFSKQASPTPSPFPHPLVHATLRPYTAAIHKVPSLEKSV
jgi:hypothetical protein